MRIGIAGIGTMGEPIARRLLAANVRVTLWNRTSSKAEALTPFGAKFAVDLDDFFQSCSVIILMLGSEAAADEVLGRLSGDLNQRVQGRLICQMATTSVQHSLVLHEAITNAGGRYVECPVSGSRIPAERGELVAMLAGAQADKDEMKKLLIPLTSRVVDCGAIPNGLAMKHATNMVLIPLLVGLTEAVAFARASQLNLERFAEILLGGQISSGILAAKLPKVLAQDYAPQAAVKNVLDSAQVAKASADAMGLPLGVFSACQEALRRAALAGYSDEDVLAVEKTFDQKQ